MIYSQIFSLAHYYETCVTACKETTMLFGGGGGEVAKYPMLSLLTSKLDKKSFQTEIQRI